MRDDFWVHPDNFQYTPGEVKWLLRLLPELRKEGLSWPIPAGKETGYTNTAISNKTQYYEGKIPEKGAATIGHLENMLCKQGNNGMMVKLYYSAQEDIEMIGRYFNLPYQVVEKAMKNTLDRICYTVNGWRSGS